MRIKLLFYIFILSSWNLFSQHPHMQIAGPMAARVQANSATVWVQLREEASVHCTCQPEQAKEAISSDTLMSVAKENFVLHLSLKKLLADTHYPCKLWVNGTEQGEKFQFYFRSLPERSEEWDIKMAVGSCAYLNDSTTASDQGWFKFGGKTTVFNQIASHQPDFMFWLGDNIYLRDGEWNSQAGIWYRYRHTRFHPAMQNLLHTGSHLAIWDDHDFGPNDSDSTYALRDMSAASFRQFWPGPAPVDSNSIYASYRMGDIELFLMDDRYHRAPNDAEDSKRKAFLGKRQLNWLIQSLKASDANFKIVAIGTQVLSNCNFAEGYIFGYEQEFNELIQRIRDEQINGVLFFSGDKHLTEISRLDVPGLYPLFDFTFSPMSSFPVPFKLSNSHRVKGTFVGKRNFGILHFLGKGDNRRMHIAVYSAKGRLLWQRKIWANDLIIKAAE